MQMAVWMVVLTDALMAVWMVVLMAVQMAVQKVPRQLATSFPESSEPMDC